MLNHATAVILHGKWRYRAGRHRHERRRRCLKRNASVEEHAVELPLFLEREQPIVRSGTIVAASDARAPNPNGRHRRPAGEGAELRTEPARVGDGIRTGELDGRERDVPLRQGIFRGDNMGR